MALTRAGLLDIRDALLTHLQQLGIFDSASAKAPDTLPGTGTHAFLEFGRAIPARKSGLSSTSMVLLYYLTIFHPLSTDPGEDIDVDVLTAVDAVLESLIGDFELGGLVRMVDVRGSEQAGGGSGAGLVADLGYADMPEGKFRTALMTIPMVVNDLYAEMP